MGVPFMAADTLNENTISRAIQYMLASKAAEQQIEKAVYSAMQFKVRSQYDIRSMTTQIRISWQDPKRPEVCRAIDCHINDTTARDIGFIASEVKGVLDNIDLRGELYFFRLDRHFPRRIGAIKCSADGAVTVTFKNGRTVETTEDELEHPEFLATCGMIYDL